MSIISLLVLKPERLPSLEAMKRAAQLARDRIEFTHDVDLRTHTGFLPVRVFDRDTGFEYYFEPIPDGELPTEATPFGSHQIVTRTGSSFEEGRAALVFLKLAAGLSDGAYVYPDDGTVVPPGAVGAFLDEQIATYEKFI